MNNRPVVLVNCAPIMDLHKNFPSIVLMPQIGEIPMGLLYLSGELERAGFEVLIKDNSINLLPNEKLADEIASLNPLLVGFSLLAFNVRSARDVARLLKYKRPDTPVIFGGPHATLLPFEQAALNFVDLVITGQGEISLKDVAIQIRNGEFRYPKVQISNKIVRGIVPNTLDELAFPSRHLININQYKRKSYVMDAVPTDIICSSRGCPFKCTFCSSKNFWEQKYHMRSPYSVVDEIEMMIKNYGSQGIYFREDNFCVSRRHVRGICEELIKRNIHIKWECESRVDTLNKEDLSLMKNAGCDGIWCGVESGSQRILNTIKKGYSVDQIQTFFNWCYELNIPAAACFMIGFPGETDQDIMKTYKLAISLPIKWAQFATYVGFPKTELYDEILRNSLWESRWEDVLITRNEQFSSQQLFKLELAMNRDAAKVLNLTQRNDNNLSMFFKIFIKNLKNPMYLIKRIKLLSKDILRDILNKNKKFSFEKLLIEFSKNSQRSNP